MFTERAFVSAPGPFGCFECVCHTCLAREDDDGEVRAGFRVRRCVVSHASSHTCNLQNLLRCDTCRWAHWCSPACRGADTAHDDIECGAMAELKYRTLDVPATVTLASRLLRAVMPDAPRHADDATRLGAQATLSRTLVGLSPELDDAPLAAHVPLVLRLAGRPPEHAPQALQALAQLQRNHFRVIDERGVVVGAALFPAAARMNHSCAPNVEVSTRESGAGWELRVEAAADVLRGEELLFSYVATHADRGDAANTLQRQYLFTCACGAPECCCRDVCDDAH